METNGGLTLQQNTEMKTILRIFLMALLAFFIEFFVFQFRYWGDVGNQEVYVPLQLGNYSDGAKLLQDGTVICEQEDGICRVAFDLRSLGGVTIRNISFRVDCPDGEDRWDTFDGKNYAVLHSSMVEGKLVLTQGEENRLVELGYLGADGAKAEVRSMPRGSRPDTITMQFQGLKGEKVHLSEIRLNVRREMHFSVARYTVCLFLLILILMVHPKSILWNMEILQEDIVMKRRIHYCGLLAFVIFSAFVIYFVLQNPVYVQGEAGFTPYKELAHALANGQTWLEELPSKELLELKDPYDFLERMNSGVKYKLDYALYDGKYYVYFGVVPCLLFFLPAYLAAGIDVPGWAVVSGLILLLYIGLGAFLKAFCARYFRRTSIAAYLLLRIGMVAVLSIPMIVSDPCAYYIPMLSGVVFYIYGLCFYLKAVMAADDGHRECGWIIAGSISMALVAGCRPQLVLAVIAILPAMIRYFYHKEEKGIKICWNRCLAFVLPYLPVALGLMYYNAIRFGSPFDFGASYNLTFANTYHWSFHKEAVGAGLVYYLLRLPKYIAQAPYLEMTHLEWTNPGLLANHTSTGGLFMLYPILWGGLLLLAHKKKKGQLEQEIRRMGFLWLGITVFMAALTAVAGGLMDRYRMDYAIFAALAYAAGILLFAKEERTAGKQTEDTAKRWGRKEVVRCIWGIVTILAMATCISTYFEEGVWWIADANPEWYSFLAQGIEFWR